VECGQEYPFCQTPFASRFSSGLFNVRPHLLSIVLSRNFQVFKLVVYVWQSKTGGDGGQLPLIAFYLLVNYRPLLDPHLLYWMAGWQPPLVLVRRKILYMPREERIAESHQVQ
jgi:hypothetical protein